MRKLLPFIAAVGLLLGVVAPAAAADTFTMTVKDFTESFAEQNPCTGDPGLATVTYNGVFHFSVDETGGSHVTGTQTGTFTFEPTDPSLPTYTGRFTGWFGENLNANNDGFWSTFRIRGTGSDGSMLYFNGNMQFHLSNGELQVDFMKFTCRD